MAALKKQTKVLLLVILLVAGFLRLWKLDKVPISLFSDELDVGYQAYSILKTGKDYFGNPWPLHFQSYVEYRAPLYIYSAVPTVGLFGITPYGIRLPAAVFGILGVWMMYLLVKQLIIYSQLKENIYTEVLPLISAFVLAFNPWHIHYSRAAFEVSELIFLILCGLYFYFRSLKEPKFLWVSALFIGLAPWTYSTAKLFVPMLTVFLSAVWYKQLIKFPKADLIRACFALFVLALPLAYVILFGGGAQRFNYISVFSDPTAATEVDFARLTDAKVRYSYGRGLFSKVSSRIVHNKLNFWDAKILTNYFESFSTNFLFLRGDISLRHSVVGVGQFYKFEALLLLLGIIFFSTSKFNLKTKSIILFWILAGALPSAITNEGGAHATRMIIIMPPLVFLISFGLLETVNIIKNKYYKNAFILTYLAVFLLSFFFYQHNYWVHFPWYSERWWHAGFKEVISAIKERDDDYDKIIITNAEERPYIFFAAYYNYDPALWQKGFQNEKVNGFGELKRIGKFYFGQVDGQVGFENLPGVMDDKTLYVAARRELDLNLILEPEKTPKGFRLVKAISFPSGEPAFYLLEKAKL